MKFRKAFIPMSLVALILVGLLVFPATAASANLLDLDKNLDNFNVEGKAPDFFFKSGGPTLELVNGTIVLTDRTADYFGIDIRTSSLLTLIPDATEFPSGDYVITVKGVLGSAITDLCFQDTNGYKWIKGVKDVPVGDFELSHTMTAADLNGMLASGGNIRFTGSVNVDITINSVTFEGAAVTVPTETPDPTTAPTTGFAVNPNGIAYSSTAGGDEWSGANILLGNDSSVWPFAEAEGDIAFTPEKGATYRLTFDVTSTGAAGLRVRWVSANDNGSYTAGDTAIVNDHVKTVDEIATVIPAYFQNTLASGETKTFVVEFTADGSATAGGLIGHIAIRGQQGSSDLTVNNVDIVKVGGDIPQPTPTPVPQPTPTAEPAPTPVQPAPTTAPQPEPTPVQPAPTAAPQPEPTPEQPAPTPEQPAPTPVPTPAPNPSTGDSSLIIFALAILATASAGAVLILRKNKATR